MRKTTSNSDKPIRRRDLVWSTCKCWTILATVGLLLTNHMLGSGLFSATLLKSWRSVEGGKIGNLEHGTWERRGTRPEHGAKKAGEKSFCLSLVHERYLCRFT